MSSAENKQLLVTQANKLVEARYSLTVGEQRLILTMISLIEPHDEDFKDYEIKITDLARILNLNSKNIYEQTEVILQRLMERVLHIPEPTGYLKTHWVSSARYHDGKGLITIAFDPKLKPYLLKLKEQFTRYRLTVIAQFKSAYTIRLYSLLKQYESIGYREFDLEKLKQILGIQEGEYQEYKRFKQRVLSQVKKELDFKDKKTGLYKSDITFELEEIKEGRRVKILHFEIIRREQVYQEELPLALSRESSPAKPDAPATDIPALPVYQRLIHFGIAEPLASQWINLYGGDYLKQKLDYTEAQEKLGNIKGSPSGFLVSAVTNDYQPPEEQKKKRTQARKKQETKAQRQEQEQAQQKKQQARSEQQKVEDYLAGLSPAQLESLQAEFLQAHREDKVVMQQHRKNGFKSAAVQALFRGYVRQAIPFGERLTS